MALTYRETNNRIRVYGDVNKCFVNKIRFVYSGSSDTTFQDVCDNFESLYNYKGAYPSILEYARSVTGSMKSRLIVDISPVKLNRALGCGTIVR